MRRSSLNLVVVRVMIFDIVIPREEIFNFCSLTFVGLYVYLGINCMFRYITRKYRFVFGHGPMIFDRVIF
jgi:hypothetical protein